MQCCSRFAVEFVAVAEAAADAIAQGVAVVLSSSPSPLPSSLSSIGLNQNLEPQREVTDGRQHDFQTMFMQFPQDFVYREKH